MDQQTASRQLFKLIWPGALVSQAIYVVARLGVADHIDDEPTSVEHLAVIVEAQPDRLHRVLRVLTSVGVFAEDTEGMFVHTELSRTLRDDHAQSTRPWAVFLGSEWIWRPWGELYTTVRGGDPPFKAIFGQGFYEYMAERPAEAAIYDGAMSAGSAKMVDVIVSAFDFSRFDTIVDVGGGQGELLKGILTANPSARGVLQDLPRVVEGASALRSGAMAKRCRVVGRDFFEGVAEGGDLYLLKGIIHGFTDQDAIKLLRLCREVIRPGGRLLIIETVPQAGQEGNPREAFMDLMMLALVPGCERSREQLAPVLEVAGFALTEVIRTPSPNAIVVAEPR